MRPSRVFLGTTVLVAAACTALGAGFLGACDDTTQWQLPPLHEAGAAPDVPQVDAYQAPEAGEDGGDAASDARADVVSDALEEGSADAAADAPEDVADE
jgi:hypothetical protein